LFVRWAQIVVLDDLVLNGLNIQSDNGRTVVVI
jgi:hypothetical protein